MNSLSLRRTPYSSCASTAVQTSRRVCFSLSRRNRAIHWLVGLSLFLLLAGHQSLLSQVTAPTEPVGTASATQTATITLTSSFTLGSISVVTQGASGLDFNVVSGGTCTVGTAYTATQSCTVNFTFDPTAPGTRYGAIVLFDNTTPTAVARSTTYLTGTGTGSMSVHYPGTQISIGSSLNYALGVAVDASGNIYIADNGNNRVLKVPPTDPTCAISGDCTLVGSGLNHPEGVAVDGAGNVYISDFINNGRVLMETLSGGSYTQSVIVGSGLQHPFGLTVDAKGDVYIGDSGNSRVLKETLSGGSYTPSNVGFDAGLYAPYAVAVDGNGYLYIADWGDSRVLKVPPTDPTCVTSGDCTTVGSGIGSNGPNGMTVDGNGNVYIVDNWNNRVLMETPSGSSYTQSVLLGSGLSDPFGVAVGSNGNVYISDLNNNRVLELDVSNQPTEPIGTASATQTAQILLSSSFTLGSISVVTGGATGLDFNVASGGDCTVGTAYTAGQICTVNYTFTPTSPGTRYGAIVLFDNTTPTPVAQSTTYITGVGTGPMTVFYPAAGLTLLSLSGIGNPDGVAVDESGNVYVAEQQNNQVVKEKLSGGSYTQSTVGSGLNNPEGVGVDGAGNVYIDDTFNNRVLKETLSGGTYTQSVVAGINRPTGTAVDGSGNVYITEGFYNNAAVKESLSGGSYTQSSVGSGVGQCDAGEGVAVDGSGNVYIADACNSRILKVPPSDLTCATAGDCTSLGSGLNGPESVAVDGSGNVYIADTYDARVLLETPSGSGYTQSVLATTSSNNLGQPVTIAVDGSGNPYIGDFSTGHVLKLNASSPPSLSFASTAVGNTSSDSPKTVNVWNLGNVALTLPIPSSGNNPAIAANFTWNSVGSSACPLISSSASSPGTLALGTSCTLPISFAPTASGSISGSLVITDNDLNGSNVAQTIHLSGTATGVGTTTTLSSSLNPSAYGQSVTITATVAKTSGTVTPTGTVQFSVDGSAVGSAVTLSGGTATYSTSTLAAGTHSITAAYTPATGSGFTSSSATALSQVVNKAMLTVTAPSPSITYGQTLPTYTATYSGYQNGDTSSALSGSPSLTTSPATPSAAGTYTITGAAGSLSATNYSFSFVNGTLTINKAVLTVTAPSPSITYGQTLPTYTATYSGYQNGDTSSVLSGSPSLTTSPATPTSVGSYTITGAVGSLTAANYTFSFVNGTLTIGKAVLTVTAPSPSITYGQTLPTYTATYSGYQNGDTSSALSGSPSLTTSPATPSAAGSYTITAAVGSLSASNYSFTFVSGTLTIGKAVLTVTAPSPTITYGQTLPIYTATYSGYQNGDTSSVLSGSPSLTTSPAAPSAAGSYTITAAVGSLSASNYTFTFANGTLTINKATLTVTAASPTITYGQAVPTYTASYSGYQNGDISSVLSGSPSLTTSPATPSAAGTYAITAAAGSLSATNYTFTFVNGTLTINKAASSVSATSSANPVFMQNPITLTATVSSAAGSPTGTVTFQDGGTPLSQCTAVAMTSGVATCTISTMSASTHPITAVYSGDSNFLTSTSSALSEAVDDFTITTTNSSVTTTLGGTAAYTLTVSPAAGDSGFPAAVILSASGVPAGATYNCIPWSLAAGASTTNVAVTIQLPQTMATGHPATGSPGRLATRIAPFALSLLLLPFAGRMRKSDRRFYRLLSVLLLSIAGMAALAGFSGCSSGTGFYGQQQTSYTLTVTATSGALSHSTTVTLTVETIG